MKSVKAWGYLCRDKKGDYTVMAPHASIRKPFCANPPVRVRVVRETDWKKARVEKMEREKEATK